MNVLQKNICDTARSSKYYLCIYTTSILYLKYFLIILQPTLLYSIL